MTKKSLPDFETLEEFASFVETRDMTDYLHEFERVEVERFPLNNRRKT